MYVCVWGGGADQAGVCENRRGCRWGGGCKRVGRKGTLDAAGARGGAGGEATRVVLCGEQGSGQGAGNGPPLGGAAPGRRSDRAGVKKGAAPFPRQKSGRKEGKERTNLSRGRGATAGAAAEAAAAREATGANARARPRGGAPWGAQGAGREGVVGAARWGGLMAGERPRPATPPAAVMKGGGLDR